jgi:hypothetical protein
LHYLDLDDFYRYLVGPLCVAKTHKGAGLVPKIVNIPLHQVFDRKYREVVENFTFGSVHALQEHCRVPSVVEVFDMTQMLVKELDISPPSREVLRDLTYDGYHWTTLVNVHKVQAVMEFLERNWDV